MHVEHSVCMAFKSLQVQMMVLRRVEGVPVSETFHTAALRFAPSPVPTWPVLGGEGAPPSDLISCLQPGRMVVPSPIVQHFLILLAPSDSPNMKS